MADDDSYFENYSGPSESSFADLEARIGELESKLADESHSDGSGFSLGYGLGMCIAVVLSWSRNASILWCIVHGICSWFYVIYIAISDWVSKS
jgi:hypothetical protein